MPRGAMASSLAMRSDDNSLEQRCAAGVIAARDSTVCCRVPVAATPATSLPFS